MTDDKKHVTFAMDDSFKIDEKAPEQIQQSPEVIQKDRKHIFSHKMKSKCNTCAKKNFLRFLKGGGFA